MQAVGAQHADKTAPEWGPLYAFLEALETRAAKVSFDCQVATPGVLQPLWNRYRHSGPASAVDRWSLLM